MSKTIGVLGGMGPYASLDFLRLLLDRSNVKKESDHFRVILDSNPNMPSRTRSYLYNEADPVPAMKEGVKTLMLAGADFIVVPCNSAHYFLPRVFDELPIPFINMIELTSQRIVQQGWTKVGLLAGEVTVGAGLYEDYLNPRNISVIQVSNVEQKIVRNVIEDVKNGVISSATESHLLGLLNLLVRNGAQSIVLGCTELQAVASRLRVNTPIIDSLEILALAAIFEAKKY